MKLDDLYQTDVEFWKQLPTPQEAKQHAAYMEEAEDAVYKAHKDWHSVTPEARAYFIEWLINHPKFEQWADEYMRGDAYAEGTMSDIHADACSHFVESRLP